ncbi:MAG: O-antigen ligase family protein [Myxococcales bacterium]|nr:O-antigen ligase family protein [Myxococcales bacterium]
MSSLHRRLRDVPIAPVLLALVVLGSVMAVGTVHVSVLLVVSAVALAGTALVLWVARRAVGGLPGPSWVLLGLAGWSALQALPLPFGLLSRIAPGNADVWGRALRPFGEGAPAFASISLDPGASLVEALKWTTYAAVFAVAFVAGKRHGRYWGPVIVFFSAVAVALVTLIHGLVGAKALFGIYTPVQAVPRWGLPPLLNPNNLSGYLNLGVFCGAGLLLTHRSSESERPLPPEWLVTAGIATVVGISVLAASRGGVLGLGIGGVALAALVQLSRSGRRRRAGVGGSRRRIATVGAAIAGGALLAALGSSEATRSELGSASAEKLRLLAWSKPLMLDHAWFGVGRGAFETTFPAYRAAAGSTLYAHAENFVVQWVAEWGLPVSAIAILLLAWCLRPRSFAVREHRAALGVLVGGGVLLLQNLADLALEVPAVVIALAAAAGSVYQCAAEPDLRGSPWARWKRRLPSAAVIVLGVAVWGLALARGRHPVGVERIEVHALFRALSSAHPPTWQAIQERLRAAIQRHPGEPYFALIGAMAARRATDGQVMAWITAALERDPNSGQAHLILSDILARRGAKLQALMELRLAVEREPGLSDVVGARALALSKEWSELVRAVPEGDRGAHVFVGMAAAARAPAERELRSQLLTAALERDSGLMRARVGRAEDAVAALELRDAACAQDGQNRCRSIADEEIVAIARLDARSCVPVLLSTRLLVVDGKERAAADQLAAKCPGCREVGRCVQARAMLVARFGSPQEFKDVARAVLAAECQTPQACAGAHELIAALHGQRGEWGSAADQLARALQAGEKADLYLKLADAAARAGDLARARSALRHAERLGKRDAAVERRLAELESQRLQPRLPGP